MGQGHGEPHPGLPCCPRWHRVHWVGDHKLYALDIASGAVLWSFTTDDWVLAAVCLADNALVVVSKDNLLHVVDTNTGRRRLVYEHGRARQILGGPATQADRVYVGSQKGRVWAIDWRERSLPWDRLHPLLEDYLSRLGLAAPSAVAAGKCMGGPRSKVTWPNRRLSPAVEFTLPASQAWSLLWGHPRERCCGKRTWGVR